MRFTWLVWAFLTAGLALAYSQEPKIPPQSQGIPEDECQWISRPYTLDPPSANIRVQSNLVEVPVVVRDSHERPVSDLRKEDFLLFDDGKPQPIQIFSVQNAGPGPMLPKQTAATVEMPAPPVAVATPPQARFVALFFDDLNTTRDKADLLSDFQTAISRLTFARTAAEKFIRKGLDPGEKAGIFTASGAMSLDFTDNTEKLLATVAGLRLYMAASKGCASLTDYEAWLIVHTGVMFNGRRAGGLLAACAEQRVTMAEGYAQDTLRSLLDVVRHLGNAPGHRTLVLLSSGFLSPSLRKDQQRVVEAAVQAGIAINSIDTAGLPIHSYMEDPEHFNIVLPMTEMAQGTGGTFFHNNNDLAEGLHELTTPPSVSYVLGFSPGDIKADGSKHTLKVKLATRSGLSVCARPSYYAPGGELSGPELRFQKLEKAVTADKESAEIPIQFSVVPGVSASGQPVIQVAIHVDAHKLSFADIGDRKVERLIFITALFDGGNHFLSGVEGVMDMRLKTPTYTRISSEGLDAKLTLNAPPGSYRIRQVVQETIAGYIAAVSRVVEIH
jgi:VWFA-related protein